MADIKDTRSKISPGQALDASDSFVDAADRVPDRNVDSPVEAREPDENVVKTKKDVAIEKEKQAAEDAASTTTNQPESKKS